uniref:Uncharacterized protein n=1 Tax=Arundo donax TaxID=35708 RepID=A0A0A9FF87_ARUDO
MRHTSHCLVASP